MPAENVTISGGFEYADGVGTRLVGRSISVEGDVGVNFYMEIDPEIAASETAYIQFTIPTGDKTETETIPVSEAERKDGCYVFQCDVAAKEMTSEIKAQIIDPESGKSGAVYTYSVKEYADALLSHAEGNWKFTKVAPLVKSMLNYGTAAQNYFDRNTKKPANADLSDEDRTLGEITNQLDAWENYKDIRGIVQLVHGKNEHKGRYIAFMRFLASNGFLTHRTEVIFIRAAPPRWWRICTRSRWTSKITRLNIAAEGTFRSPCWVTAGARLRRAATSENMTRISASSA